jgi:probable rRNA maturation factor
VIDVRLEGVADPVGVEAIAERVLEAVGLREAELSIVLCDDAFIQPLNRDYRKKDRPTDVLSFPQREGEESDPEDPVLGDIVVSVERARAQADERGHPLEAEMRVLLVHGILHLLGYDHEEDADAEIMEAEERRVFAAVFPPPPQDGSVPEGRRGRTSRSPRKR